MPQAAKSMHINTEAPPKAVFSYLDEDCSERTNKMKQFAVVVIFLSLLGFALTSGEGDKDSHDDHDGHTLREHGHHEGDGHDHTEEELNAVVPHDNDHPGAFSVMCSLVTMKKGTHKKGAHVEIILVEPKAIAIDIDWETMPVKEELVKEVHLHMNERTKFEVTTTKEGDETVKGSHTVWVNTTKVKDHGHDEYVFNITVESHEGSKGHLILYRSEDSKATRRGKLSEYEFTYPAGTEFEVMMVNKMYGVIKLSKCRVVDDYDNHDHDHEDDDHDPNDGGDHSGHNH